MDAEAGGCGLWAAVERTNEGQVQQIGANGRKAVVFSPKERRQAVEQETTQKCFYLRMAKEVAYGYRLLQYSVADNGMLGESVWGNQVGPHATLPTSR